MDNPGRPRLLAIALALLAVPVLAWAHGAGSYQDIYDSVIVGGGCNNCHSSGSQNGGFLAPGGDENAWYTALVGGKPSNAAAANLGKLRVAPYEPWNSSFLEKITGDLKSGEGRPMPPLTHGYAKSTCPGAIDKIAIWIRDGAQHAGFGHDVNPGTIDCDKAEPTFAAPPAPGAGIQVTGESFQVVEPAREDEHTTTLSAVTPSDLAVNRIEIVASAGTEYVVVSREGDSAPLAVARGESLDLTLPDGVAVELAAGKGLEIRQRIRNDYWSCPQSSSPGVCAVDYVNQTVGNVAVNLYSIDAGSVKHSASPFIDTTGTQALFAPPRGIGSTGGVWTGSPPAAVNGLVAGVWTDSRALETTLVDAAGQTLAEENNVGPGNTKPSVRHSYVAIADAGLPVGTVIYHCTHGNGSTATEGNTAPQLAQFYQYISPLSVPYRYGCADMASPAGNLINIPTGLPVILGGSPAQDCSRSINDPANSNYGFPPYVDSDCSSTPINSCQPANLVGGDGVNDGRCSLVGLAW